MDLECIVIGTCCLYSHIGRHLDNIYAFEIWHEMILLFGNFHDSLKLSWKHSSVMAWIYFSWCCALMKCISWRWLSQNTKFSRNSFHDGDSHEIHSMTVTLTKCLTLTKLIRDGYLSWNTTRNPHENTYANLEATLFSWGWPSRTPVRKIIRGGQLSWKWDFRVSIIVRVFAWQCTLTNYFCESKSIFRDVICTLTKSLDSGSEYRSSSSIHVYHQG